MGRTVEAELAGDTDDIDEMLTEIEQKASDEANGEARNQLELFGALLTDLATSKRDTETHRVVRDDREYIGTWDDIVSAMRDANGTFAGRSLSEFMLNEARRGLSITGVHIPTHDAESFVRGSADAGLFPCASCGDRSRRRRRRGGFGRAGAGPNTFLQAVPARGSGRERASHRPAKRSHPPRAPGPIRARRRGRDVRQGRVLR